jgi:hypothetical protein
MFLAPRRWITVQFAQLAGVINLQDMTVYTRTDSGCPFMRWFTKQCEWHDASTHARAFLRTCHCFHACARSLPHLHYVRTINWGYFAYSTHNFRQLCGSDRDEDMISYLCVSGDHTSRLDRETMQNNTQFKQIMFSDEGRIETLRTITDYSALDYVLWTEKEAFVTDVCKELL